MKFAKDIALIAMGAGAVLAYQKYERPVRKQASRTVNKALKKTNDLLEDMK